MRDAGEVAVMAEGLGPVPLERMRAAGRATVARYSDEAVLPLWTAALRRRRAVGRRSVRSAQPVRLAIRRLGALLHKKS